MLSFSILFQWLKGDIDDEDPNMGNDCDDM